ncbi:hypothetical protein MLD38_016811 [Melastoma candidum]|uniref:Uncharacterized protein n=1 Tax=Melastoma candidum TaxID=119954 RepID=A0ACB9QQG0_9MYRT|nr:hypothetical protein MLD38_016811 [Melastoma candidum]
MTFGGRIPLNVRTSLKRALLDTKPVSPSFVPKNPTALSTDLIKACFWEGLVDRARLLFDEMPYRDSVAYTVMISGYASCELYRDALTTFQRMLVEEESMHSPNEFVLSSTLKACGGIGSLACGRALHCFAVKVGVDRNVYVENVLVGLYAGCGMSMDDACTVFRGIRERNAVSWTTLISGFAHNGQGFDAIMVFRQMLLVCYFLCISSAFL